MLPPDPSPAPPSRNRRQAIFLGPDGIRAGWRLLMFFAILAGLFSLTGPLQRRAAHRLSTGLRPHALLLNEIIGFTLLWLATFLMSRLEHRSIAQYGLPWQRMFRKDFWTGALWGVVMVSIIVGLMGIFHAYSPGGLALSGFAIVKFASLWALAFLLVGFFEEFLFRGYIQFTLTTGLGFWPAAGITCLLFALGHRGNPGENWVGLAEIVLIALFLCMALRRTGSLWFAIGWHMAFDWGETFLYSTPNSGMQATGHLFNASLMGSKWLSGGSVGPEASVFDLIVTIAGILLLARLYPEAKYPGEAPAAPPLVLQPAAPQLPLAT